MDIDTSNTPIKKGIINANFEIAVFPKPFLDSWRTLDCVSAVQFLRDGFIGR